MKYEVFKSIIPELLKCKEDKFRYDGDLSLLFFKKDDYWVQRIPNIYYGFVVKENGTIIPSYPHLNNYKENRLEFALTNAYNEDKHNGTNLALGKFDGEIIKRTRTVPNSQDFPVTIFSNDDLNQIKDENIKKKIFDIRKEMVSKYPEYYINMGNFEFVGLKTQVVVKDILGDKIEKMFNSFPEYMFFFELVGKINPIIIEGTAEYGMYDFDKDLILIDILHIKTNVFVSREKKEFMAKHINLNIVEKTMSFNNPDEVKCLISKIKENADINKQEGYVLKFENTRIKIKSDMVLSAARRSVAIMKGYIYPDDLNEYMSKIITTDALKHPNKFDELINEISMEAKIDYPNELVDNNKYIIMKKVAIKMAIFLADDIIKEKDWKNNKDELFRFMNLEIPKRFKPLQKYMDFNLEQSTKDMKLKKRLKHRRVEIFKKVSGYCFLNFLKGK